MTGHVLHGRTNAPGFLLVAGLPGFLLVAGPLSLLLCCLRTALILLGDRQIRLTSSNCSKQELIRIYRNYVREVRRLALWEAGLLAIAGLGLALFDMDGVPMLLLALLYGAAAILILMDQISSNPVSTAEDLFSLRAQYCQVLMQRHQSRRFLSWLWLAPAFLELHVVANRGFIEAVEASVAAVLLCFLATALNRESSGRTGEETGLLARLDERRWAPESLAYRGHSE